MAKRRRLTRIYCNPKLKREIEITKAEHGYKTMDETTEDLAEVVKEWRKDRKIRYRKYGEIRF